MALTLWNTEAASDPRETLELHLHGFHRATPELFQTYGNLGRC